MRERMKKKKNMIIGGLVALIFLMSVGYAAFASSLNISGTANTSSWIIKITNIREKTHTGGADTVSTSFTDLSATFSSTLTKPGDSITYEVTVENRGNIDASLKEVTKTFTNNTYIDVTYSGLVKGQMLYKQGQAGSTAVMEVTVTFKDLEIESLTETITSNITISLDFEQEGNNVDTTKKYLVTYNSDGGSTVESKYVSWNQYGIISDINPTRIGYNFVNWYTGPMGTGTKISTTRLSDVLSDETAEGITLYAAWTIKGGYTINYNSQGGSSISSSNSFWSDPISPNTPTKTGYTFLGWYTEPNGKGMKANGQAFSDIYQYVYGKYVDDQSNEITLYANWEESSYTISFNSRGGNEVTDIITVKWSESIPTLPTPTKEGYTFEGWYTGYNTKTKKVSGKKIIEGTSLSENGLSSNLSLNANWTAN